jgi:hypothetical protein
VRTGSGGDWRFWSTAFLLYAATAVVWTWIVVVANRGRADLAAAVAVGWVVAMAAAVAYLAWSRVKRHSGRYEA